MAPLPPFSTVTALPPVSLTNPPPGLGDDLSPGDRPLLLLPVRLETRFAHLADGGLELRVRVFPDTVHLDSHEPELTAGEQEWGRHYWTQDWSAGPDENARAAAWQQLADRFGAPRAAWIARCTEPANLADRPAQPAPPGSPPATLPRFPDLATAPDEVAWRHAPQARLLPDRWVAVLSSAGAPALVVTGRAIPALAVGPDPALAVTPVPDDTLAIDPATAWMVDFDAAESVGMGLRLPVAPALLDAGIEALHVLGVRAAGTPEDAAAAVASLLDAHHYTDGLEVLGFGTPSSNNGPVRSGFGTADPGQRRTFAAQVLRDPAALPPDSDAVRLGQALGLPGDRSGAVLGRLVGADGTHDLDQRSMTSALWEAGWGYFLSNLYGFEGTGLTPDAVAWARSHATGFVRGGGPFPALRCGRQPYGLLPVTSLDLWQGGADGDAARLGRLRDLMIHLRDNVFRPQLPQVPRLGRRQGPADPDADLAEVMHVDGFSSAYRVRSQLGRHYLEHLRAFLGENLRADGFIPAQDSLAQGPLRILGLLGAAAPPRVAHHVFAETAWPVTAPLTASESAFAAALLVQPTIAAILGLPVASLLQTLLRHALLREYAVAAARLLASGGAVGTGTFAGPLTQLLREPELVDLVQGSDVTATWQRQLDHALPAGLAPGGDPATTVRAYLEGLASFDAPAVTALGDTRRALAHLQTLDDTALRLLTSVTLDAAADRLDAWITSYATRRLAELRSGAPAGVYVGGYGWVENLSPQTPAPQPVPPVPGEDGPLITPPQDPGFIHAPSATHAVAAALLRNAHLGAGGTPTADSPFSVTLTSWGSREAVRLLDGVRRGQPLGALLGYRFERSLHDARLDRYVDAMRDLAPLVAGRLVPASTPREEIAANNVVDGLALQRQWAAAPADVTAHMRSAGADDADVAAIGACLGQLGEIIDALADALTAETAYQAARGNLARTSGTLDAIARGEAPPPELEVTRFPRSGTALTHRVAVLLPGTAGAVPGWTVGGSPRAAAEPALDAWAGLLLGDPRRVRCTVRRTDPAGPPPPTVMFPLSELGLAALDVVYTAGPAPSGGLGSELEELVVRHATAAAAAGGGWQIDPDRPPDLAPGDLALADVLEQARGVYALFAGARAGDADDLAPPDRPFADGADLTELEARVTAAETSLAAAHAALEQLLGQAGGTDPGALAAATLSLGTFGIPHATPPPGADPATLAAVAAAVLAQSGSRLDAGAQLRALPAPGDPRALRGRLADRMRAVFGPAFLPLPRFTCEAAQAAELTAALAGSAQTQDGDPLAAATWLTRAERVREPLARFASALQTAEVLGTGDRLELAVAQLPYAAGARWVGLPVPPGGTLPHGTASVVVHRPLPADLGDVLSAVLVDEWVEVVPDRQETTALTFQLDPPSTFAPQTLLLAVPPVPGQGWTVGTLQRVLAETFDLAKLRAVRSDALDVVGQYLPAVFLALNAQGDAVSTDLTPLTRPEGG
jgi:hypothetical protein